MKIIISNNEFGKGVVVQDVLTLNELIEFVSEHELAVDKSIDYGSLFELTEYLIDIGYDVEFKEEVDYVY